MPSVWESGRHGDSSGVFSEACKADGVVHWFLYLPVSCCFFVFFERFWQYLVTASTRVNLIIATLLNHQVCVEETVPLVNAKGYVLPRCRAPPDKPNGSDC